MRVRFLVDENLPSHLFRALLRREPAVSLLRVGDPGAPPLGTKDPELLDYLDRSGRLLITLDRRSMARHLAVHFRRGGHTWGILWVDPRTPV